MRTGPARRVIAAAVCVGLAVLSWVAGVSDSAHGQVSPEYTVSANALVPPLPDRSSWLEVVNYWRTLAGVAPVVEDAEWSAGAAEHARYLVINDATGHEQDASLPGATTRGALAGKNGDVARGSAEPGKALDDWMQAPFHAAWIVNPRLTRVGFGAFSDAKGAAAVLDVIRGIDPKLPKKFITFPGQGTMVPLQSFVGENPDPRDRCPVSYQRDAAVGLPLFVLLNQPPVRPAGTLRENGRSVEVCTLTGPATLASLNGVYLIPKDPLKPGARYEASVTSGATRVSWTFRSVGVPSAVRSISVDRSSAPVSVRWAPPAQDGGVELSTYTIGVLGADGLERQYGVQGDVTEFAVPDAEVAGVRVWATNAVGSGPATSAAADDGSTSSGGSTSGPPGSARTTTTKQTSRPSSKRGSGSTGASTTTRPGTGASRAVPTTRPGTPSTAGSVSSTSVPGSLPTQPSTQPTTTLSVPGAPVPAQSTVPKAGPAPVPVEPPLQAPLG